MARHGDLLPAGRGRTIVILSTPDLRPARDWARGFTGNRIYVFATTPARRWRRRHVTHLPADDLEEHVTELKRLGPVDLLIDASGSDAAETQRRWEALLYHLKPRGLYVVDKRTRTAASGELDAWAEDLQRESACAATSELKAATASVRMTARLIIVVKRHRHYLKLRDVEATELLPAREPETKVAELQRLPHGTITSRAEVRSHHSAVPIPWLPEIMNYPPLHVRHYAGRIRFAGSSLLFTDTCILPDSFRWHLEPNPRNPKIKSASPLFARIPKRLHGTRQLEGTYFHMDPNGVGHFGHFLTESIGRLWAWDQAKQEFPDLKALYRIRDMRTANQRFERKLMMAYGIAADDIVAVDEPVVLSSLVSATTMWHNAQPHYVHPAMSDVWDRISTKLIDPTAATYPRVFISRSKKWSRRRCRNAHEVEDLFREHGFEIVYPEHLDIGAQAAVFANAEVIAGFAGSAMFNVMHAKKLQVLILLSHEAYTARNEHLYSSLLGGPVHYFWSTPDVEHPRGGWRQAAFDSDWEFDFSRNRDALRDLLSSL